MLSTSLIAFAALCWLGLLFGTLLKLVLSLLMIGLFGMAMLIG